MSIFSNRQKLAAVLNKWVQPALQQIAASKISSLPFIESITHKVRSTGWVSPQWSLGAELAPYMGGLSSAIVEPFILSQIGNIPDHTIPQLAHNIVDEAIKHGSLSLFEGNIEFELEDLQELKKLLMYNLPIQEEDVYEVITESPAPNATGAKKEESKK